VQGLVKICFPKGVIQELGVNILEQHVREGHAPEDNVAHMRDGFNVEMVHQLAWLLVEHLTKPHLLKVGILSVVAATNRLHGHKFERELLDDVIVALQQLLDKPGIDEMEGLVNDAGSSMPSNDHEVNGPLDDIEDGEDERSSTIEEGDVAMDASADSLHDQPPAATMSTVESDKFTLAKLKSKHGKRKKEYIGTRQQKSINDANPEIENEGAAVQTGPKPEMGGKTKAKKHEEGVERWDVER
jgi:hypothetical protein